MAKIATRKKLLPNALLRIRQEEGLTQEELAARVHATKSAISKLELGNRKMTREWAVRFANVLDRHWAEFMDEAPLTAAEKALVDRVRGLAEEDRDALFRFAEAMAGKPGSER